MTHKKPTSRLFGLLLSILLVVIIAFGVIYTGLYGLYLLGITTVFGIATVNIVNNINQFFLNLKDALFSLTLVILSLFVFITIYKLLRWVGSDEGLVIQPFNVGGWDENTNYNGQALADSLIRELLRIHRIHNENIDLPKNVDKNIKLFLPSVSPSSENVAYNIANLGTVSQGGLGISIGQLMITLKRLSGSPGSIITGSLQKYGSTISLIAWMGHKDGKSWEVRHIASKQKADNGKKIEDEVIPDLVRQMAFKISKDIAGAKAKTCSGFRYFTEALKDFHDYSNTGDEQKLVSSIRGCNNAANIEKDYSEPADLFIAIGAEYFNNKNFDEAEKMFRRANELKEEDIDILIWLGTTLDVVDKDEEAKDKLDQAIEIAEREYKEKQRFLTRANYRLKMLRNTISRKDDDPDINPVKELEDKLFRAYNNLSSALHDLGEHDLGKYEEAKDNLVKAGKMASKLNKKDLKVLWFNKGHINTIVEEYEEAKNYLDKAIDAKYEVSSAYNLKGIIEAELHHYEKAITNYKKSIDQPEELKTDIQGLTSKRLDRSSKSSSIHKNVNRSRKGMANPMKMKFKYSNPLINMGYAYERLGNYKEAIECLEKAIQEEIQVESALRQKGHILSDQEKDDEAKACYENILEIHDQNIFLNYKDPNVWNDKGNALYHMRRYDEAMECYDKAIVVDPNFVDAWYSKGTTLHDLGRYDEAIECYGKAIKIVPNFVDAWNNKGTTLHDLGRYVEAIECYGKAIKIVPKKYAYPWYNEGISLYDLGRHVESIECFEKAIECYNEAIKADQKYLDAWYYRGLALHELGRYEDAIKSYNKATEIDGKHAQAWYDKSLAFYKLGKNEKAEEARKEAFKLNPSLKKS